MKFLADATKTSKHSGYSNVHFGFAVKPKILQTYGWQPYVNRHLLVATFHLNASSLIIVPLWNFRMCALYTLFLIYLQGEYTF